MTNAAARGRLAMLVAAGLGSSLASGPAQAQPAEFYKGKTVTLYIGGTAGGGLDAAGRIVARHMGRFLAGRPTVTPSMMPGAGGIRVIDTLATTAPRDGTIIAVIPSGPILDPLIGGRKTSYSMTDLTSIGAVIKDFSLCVAWHTTPFKTLDDARRQEMTVAGTGAGSTTDTFPLVINATLGTKFKVITGYLGTQETAMAVERGETHGRCGWSWSSLKGVKSDWLRDKKINLLIQLGVTRSSVVPDVPFVMDLAANDADRQRLALMFAPLSLSHAFLAPPGLPEGRTAELRQAFMATMVDPEVRKEAVAQLSEQPSPTSGEDMQKLIAKLYATPEPIVERLRAILRK